MHAARLARTTAVAAALAVAALLALTSAAHAGTTTATSGAVSATLKWSRASDGLGYVAHRLTITRAGVKLFDARPDAEKACGGPPCSPTVGFPRQPPLRVLDLDADGEPEVVYTAYTGGAHCCTVAQVYRLRGDQGGYSTDARNFGDPGFRLQSIDSSPQPEWVTADDRFAYRYTAYVYSGLPIQVLRWRAGRFHDVTTRYRGRIRRDARYWWRGYRKIRHRHDGTELGPVAAWAADEYHLGRRHHALRVLRREARRGRLRGPDLHGRRFVRSLDRFLRHHGYAR